MQSTVEASILCIRSTAQTSALPGRTKHRSRCCVHARGYPQSLFIVYSAPLHIKHDFRHACCSSSIYK
jgi:hypothetical protein